MIFTFYSFKGGVGRSMALANIAEVFYGRGLKVLMIDFDLEAPGLERYFDLKRSGTPDGEILDRRGVIDLILSFLDLQSFAPKRPPTATPDAAEDPAFQFSVEPLANFVVPIYDDPSQPGKLSLMPAGHRRKPDFAAYAKRVLGFEWARFYTEKDGERFFEWFRLELLREWDVILIDSRTGVTELGGVCTHHLADAVISFVATNLQNLEGSAMMARSLAHPKLVAEGRKGRPLQQLFVPSRVELSEEDKHDQFAARFNDEFRMYFPANQSPETSWFLDLRLFYMPAYSYMERVAVREPERASKADLIQAYTRLAARMASIAGAGPLFDAWASPSRTLSNLPPRNLHFAGREEDLKRIRALLPSGTPVAICGLGGVGKTSLAVEYAYRYRSDYSATLFCPVGSESEMHLRCADLVQLLPVTVTDTDPGDALRAWLEGNGGWLLILDDAIDPLLVRSILPQSPRGHLLYTTRAQQVSALHAQAVSIESMSQELSIGFLEKRIGKRDFNDSERAAAAEFVDEVGGLPLALEQAASYIANRGTRIEDYLASYRKRRLSLLDQQPAFSAGRELSVSAVIEPTLEEIEKTPASADVLRVASLLATDPVPTSLLVLGAKDLGVHIASALRTANEDPLALDEVLDPLTKFSLIDRDRKIQAFSVHKLVSDLVRERVGDVSVWQERITRAVDATFPDPTWENLVTCAPLVPHVLAALFWKDVPSLRLRVAGYMVMRGDYAGAEKCLQQTKTYSEDQESVMADELLARVYSVRGQFQDAIGLLDRADKLARKLGLSDEIQTSLLLDLAECNVAIGEMEKAGKLYATASNNSEKRGDLPNLVLALSGHAETLLKTDAVRAIETATQAVSYAEKTGLDSQAQAYGRLANLLIAAGRAPEPHTKEVVQKALMAGEKAYGPEHPAFAGLLRTYAVLLQVEGDPVGGEGVYKRAQAIVDIQGKRSVALFRAEYEGLLAAAGLRADSPIAIDTVAIAKIPKSLQPPQETGRRSLLTSPKVLLAAAAVVAAAVALPFYTRSRTTKPNAPPTIATQQVDPASNGNIAATQIPPRAPSAWGVIISADKTLEPTSPDGPSAEWEPVRAWRAQYRNVALFQKGSYYWTVIGQPDQQSAVATINKLTSHPLYSNWKQASEIHIGTWCPDAKFDRVVQVDEVAIDLYHCPAAQESPVPSVTRLDTPAPVPEATFAVGRAILQADPANYTGKCPVTINFSGQISPVGHGGVVAYTFVRSDGASSPVQLLTFNEPSVQQVSTTWSLSADYSGWEQIRVLKPTETTSEKAFFTVRCQ
jgi:cellulose biosynthesis protein BcsQ/tetratricopeptide (TPR) repeat protein